MKRVLVVVSITSMFLTCCLISPTSATTGEIGVVHHFAISPSGREVVFVSAIVSGERAPQTASIMLLDLGTGNTTGLTSTIREAVASPNNRFVACIQSDHYYDESVLLWTADGLVVRLRHEEPLSQLSQLRWSADSKYLAFTSTRWGVVRTTILSPQVGVVPDELASVEWQEPTPLLADHLLHLEKPSIRPDSMVRWAGEKTIYAQAVDGIWQGQLGQPFAIQWRRIITAADIQSLSVSPQGNHLLYTRPASVPWSSSVWVLPLQTKAEPVMLGEGSNPQFTPDGKDILFSHVGLWQVSVDGSVKHKLSRQVSQP